MMRPRARRSVLSQVRDDRSSLSRKVSADKNRRLCALHLSFMGKMRVRLPRFGDADAPLQGV